MVHSRWASVSEIIILVKNSFSVKSIEAYSIAVDVTKYAAKSCMVFVSSWVV